MRVLRNEARIPAWHSPQTAEPTCGMGAPDLQARMTASPVWAELSARCGLLWPNSSGAKRTQQHAPHSGATALDQVFRMKPSMLGNRLRAATNFRLKSFDDHQPTLLACSYEGKSHTHGPPAAPWNASRRVRLSAERRRKPLPTELLARGRKLSRRAPNFEAQHNAGVTHIAAGRIPGLPKTGCSSEA